MKRKIFLPILLLTILATGCSKAFLDRKPLDSYDDSNFWENETNVRLHSYYYYPSLWPGYGSSWTQNGFWSASKNHNDIYCYSDGQPGSYGNTGSTGGNTGTEYSVSTWGDNYIWIRRANTFIDRLENQSKDRFTAEQYGHWMGVARYIRATRYADLIWGWGGVPYIDRATDDMNYLMKDRDPRTTVADNVMADYDFAISNMRASDGPNNILNKYAAAAQASRDMLREGSWQFYHTAKYGGGDAAKGKEYLEFAVKAAEVVMSGPYAITTPYREVFASQSLEGEKEVIFARHYAAGLATHCATSYQNYNEGSAINYSANMIRSILFTDGKLINETSLLAADKSNYGDLFTKIDNKVFITHDPRLEAQQKTQRQLAGSTDGPQDGAIEAAYSTKGTGTRFYERLLFPRQWEHFTAAQAAAQTETKSASNTQDAPIFRLAEVLLNWIEAKAILAEKAGGAAITQADLDKSINVLRDRPIARPPHWTGANPSPCVNKLAKLVLGNYPNDLQRHPSVTPLMNEIRRERMIELAQEDMRHRDLRRWGTNLELMSFYDKFPGKSGQGQALALGYDFYKNTWEGNLLQCGSYFDLEDLYNRWQASKAISDLAGSTAVQKAQTIQDKASYDAFAAQATGQGLWCVTKDGQLVNWVNANYGTPDVNDPNFKNMKGWYIVGKKTLAIITNWDKTWANDPSGAYDPITREGRNTLACVPINQILYYSVNGKKVLTQNPGWETKL